MARVSSSASDGAVQLSPAHRDSSHGVAIAEKVLREWRNRTRTVAPPARSREASADEQENIPARGETPVSPRTWSHRDSTVARSVSRASVSELDSPRAEVSAPSPIHVIDRRRSARYEVDGGVRLAGGRVGEVVMDDLDRESTVGGSTFPPPYSSHFGGR